MLNTFKDTELCHQLQINKLKAWKKANRGTKDAWATVACYQRRPLNDALSTEITEANDGLLGYTLFFFYKNLFYKNVEAEIDPNFKNVLRTFLRLRVD